MCSVTLPMRRQLPVPLCVGGWVWRVYVHNLFYTIEVFESVRRHAFSEDGSKSDTCLPFRLVM